MRMQALVLVLLLALMYIPPYTLLADAPPALLLAYWTLIGMAAVVYVWLETRGWVSSG